MNYLKYGLIGLSSLSAMAGGPGENVVNTTGGKLKNNKLTIDFSVGEVAINNVGSYSIGFLQPVPVSGPLSLENKEVKEKSILLYPNPVTDKIYWNIADKDVNKVLIFAVSGVKITEADASKAEMNMEHLDSGIYYVKFLDSENIPVSVFKIIKN